MRWMIWTVTLHSHCTVGSSQKLDPNFWPDSVVTRMTLSEIILQNLIRREFRYLSPWLARLIKILQTNLDSKASHHDHDSTVAHFTEVDWVRCCFSLPTRFVGTADTRLSLINYCGPIDCLSPCNLQTKEFKISLKFQSRDYAYGHWHQGRVYFESVVANLRAHGWG